jgi:hypothetical protein
MLMGELIPRRIQLAGQAAKSRLHTQVASARATALWL